MIIDDCVTTVKPVVKWQVYISTLLLRPLRVFTLTLLKMYGYYFEVHVQRRINNFQNTASECFPGTWSCSRRDVLTYTLRQDVSRVLGPALYEVCLTCTLRQDYSRVCDPALYEVSLTCTLCQDVLRVLDPALYEMFDQYLT